MNLNATMIGQSIFFGVFLWFCWKFIWPMLMSALSERETRIADGLAAGEKGRRDLELADKRVGEMLREAKGKAAEILSQAERRAGEISDEAKAQARVEAERILSGAQTEIEQEMNRARDALRGQVAALAVSGASQLLEREVDAGAHAELLDQLATRL
ncbi:MAG: F0F1 ATP synthase subunit B [Gammaproteobacteria bacterium]|jgi:F-type H+-transporting ATPase subunit b|nr:F0F1 ATP synthase subunit B [Gammaproteobacteria bacterium]